MRTGGGVVERDGVCGWRRDSLSVRQMWKTHFDKRQEVSLKRALRLTRAQWILTSLKE